MSTTTSLDTSANETELQAEYDRELELQFVAEMLQQHSRAADEDVNRASNPSSSQVLDVIAGGSSNEPPIATKCSPTSNDSAGYPNLGKADLVSSLQSKTDDHNTVDLHSTLEQESQRSAAHSALPPPNQPVSNHNAGNEDKQDDNIARLKAMMMALQTEVIALSAEHRWMLTTILAEVKLANLRLPAIVDSNIGPSSDQSVTPTTLSRPSSCSNLRDSYPGGALDKRALPFLHQPGPTAPYRAHLVTEREYDEKMSARFQAPSSAEVSMLRCDTCIVKFEYLTPLKYHFTNRVCEKRKKKSCKWACRTCHRPLANEQSRKNHEDNRQCHPDKTVRKIELKARHGSTPCEMPSHQSDVVCVDSHGTCAMAQTPSSALPPKDSISSHPDHGSQVSTQIRLADSQFEADVGKNLAVTHHAPGKDKPTNGVLHNPNYAARSGNVSDRVKVSHSPHDSPTMRLRPGLQQHAGFLPVNTPEGNQSYYSASWPDDMRQALQRDFACRQSIDGSFPVESRFPQEPLTFTSNQDQRPPSQSLKRPHPSPGQGYRHRPFHLPSPRVVQQNKRHTTAA